MSVINKMLQDLEKRESADQHADMSRDMPMRNTVKKRSWLRLITLVTAPCLLAVGGYYFWIMQQQVKQYDLLLKDAMSEETVHEIKVTKKPSATNISQLKEDIAEASKVITPAGNETTTSQTTNVDKVAELITATMAASDQGIIEPNATLTKLVETSSVSTSGNTHAVVSKIDLFKKGETQKARDTVLLASSIAKSAKATSVPTKNGGEKQKSAEMHIGEKPSPALFSVKTVSVTAEQLANKAFLAGESYKNRGLLEEAISQYELALKSWPTHSGSRKQIAALLFARNEASLALEVLEHGLALDTKNIELAVIAAKICMKEESYQRGLSFLVAIEGTDKKQIPAIALRASLAQKAKRYDLALADYDKLLSLNASNSRWLLGKAIALDMLGRFAEAVLVYQQVLNSGGISLASKQYVIKRLQALRDNSNG